LKEPTNHRHPMSVCYITAMTKESQSMTKESQRFTKESQSMTKESQSITKESQSMTKESQSITLTAGRHVTSHVKSIRVRSNVPRASRASEYLEMVSG